MSVPTAADDLLVVPGRQEWRAWLDANEHESDGVWLVLAKKGTLLPTSLRYDEALEEALCSGWIDGQKRGLDAATFRQRFTPRRRASMWSERNVGLVARLVEEGRMRPRGHAEVERARADGRWDRAYAGAATAQVPADLADSLAQHPVAGTRFATLSGQERYSILHRVLTAPSASSRTARIRRAVETLEHGAPHERTRMPQQDGETPPGR